ncbi:MAG TPA: heme ABC transporter permease CcmC [Steroidobacteraceae bacterium]|nr:heme ABC transporter permease CcmC [Steroidobacteraceae bacterium]
MAWTWLHRFGSPPHFYRVAGRLTPWFAWPAAVLIVAGLTWGLVFAPPDAVQSDAYRIIYVHVPNAFLSEMSYTLMAVAAAVGLIWRIKVAHAVAAAIAPAGAVFTAVALATGMLWGQPMWGTWWAWDPRLVFELVLLFFFLGYAALRSAIDELDRADRASGLLAIVGLINVPLVHYSVVWWYSLHQGSTIFRAGGPAMPASMLWPLLLSILGHTLFFGAILLARARAEVLRRERSGVWLAEVVG